MALTRTSRLTGTAVHTMGAVKPPIDWATSTTSRRRPMAAVTRPAYSRSPADSSSPGRSTAIASWPAASSSGTTGDQNDAVPPAPGISTNVLTGSSLALGVRRYDARGRAHSPAAGTLSPVNRPGRYGASSAWPASPGSSALSNSAVMSAARCAPRVTPLWVTATYTPGAPGSQPTMDWPSAGIGRTHTRYPVTVAPSSTPVTR